MEESETKDGSSVVVSSSRLRSAPCGGWPIALAILVVGMSWVGLKTWESYRAGRLLTFGPIELFDTSCWGDSSVLGCDQGVSIRWRWRRTDVTAKVMQDASSTLCIVSGILKNNDKSRELRVWSVKLLLKDAAGTELHEMSETLGWGTSSGPVKQQSDWPKWAFWGQPLDSFGTQPSDALKPGESRVFTIRQNVPTGLLRDVASLGARLWFDLADANQRK